MRRAQAIAHRSRLRFTGINISTTSSLGSTCPPRRFRGERCSGRVGYVSKKAAEHEARAYGLEVEVTDYRSA